MIEDLTLEQLKVLQVQLTGFIEEFQREKREVDAQIKKLMNRENEV